MHFLQRLPAIASLRKISACLKKLLRTGWFRNVPVLHLEYDNLHLARLAVQSLVFQGIIRVTASADAEY